ncbi:MAG: class I SAM-dependent methyltransferase [Actinomycetes bacterium]
MTDHKMDLGGVKTRYEVLLQRLHLALVPRTYLEIGIHSGASIALTGPNTFVIGIDPEPQLRIEPPARVQIFAQTSDDFFASNQPLALLQNRSIDLAFIDGMHLFEFALRDFINVERSMTADGVIVIDDCFPREPGEAARERTTDRWTGDVWKLIICLQRYRPDLAVNVIDVDPAGVGIVTGLDPNSTVLADAYDEILVEYLEMGYDHIAGDERRLLHVRPYKWHRIKRSLPRVPLGPITLEMRARRLAVIAEIEARRIISPKWRGRVKSLLAKAPPSP